MIDAALQYLGLGYSVIPVKKDKRPLIPWEAYQKKRATEDEVRRWFARWPDMNIGIVTGSISGVVVVDIDTEEGRENIERVIPPSLPFAVAKTPRGGRHLFFRCPDKPISNNAGAIPGADFRGEGGYVLAAPSVSEKGVGYRWIAEPGPCLPALPKSYIDSVRVETTTRTYDPGARMFEVGRRDNDLFHTANALIKGGMQPEAVGQVLEKIVTPWMSKEFDRKFVETKVSSAIKRANSREGVLSTGVSEWVAATAGRFSVSDIYSTFQVSGVEGRSSVRDILLGLEAEGVIERYGERDGSWRKISDDCPNIDWRSAPEDDIDIKWPFGIERYVRTFPKNIIVVAGASDSGKTGFLLNLVYRNMHRHKINYFSSEMGAIEMRARLSNFNCSLDDWYFVAKERASDFSDVIRPDEINIIDFLELHEDFWRVGAMIKAIFDKLEKGVAIIAIQKNSSTNDRVKLHGLGGERGIEKARLYLAMDRGVLRIVKGKNWRKPEINPTGMRIDFSLVQGCRFFENSSWEREVAPLP